MRAALAVAAPDWLTGVIEASWQQVYGARIDNLHLPESQAKRQALMVDYGKDGYHLLEQVHRPDAPIWLRELPAVQTLRRIWVQQFYREVTDGRQEVRRREKLPEGDGLPPGERPPHLPLRSRRPPQRQTRSRLGRIQSPLHSRPAMPPAHTPISPRAPTRARSRHWISTGATGRI